MRKTLRWLLVILSFSIAILAMGSILFSVGAMRSSGERASGAEYSILRNALLGIESKDDMDDLFLRQRLLALYRGSERLLAAQVLDSSGAVVWKIPGDSSYFALPGSSASRAGFSAPDWSTVIFTTPLSNGMKLASLFVTLRRADFVQALKTPLIILAIWFVIVILAFVFLRKPDPEVNQEPPKEDKTEQAPEIQEATASEISATPPAAPEQAQVEAGADKSATIPPEAQLDIDEEEEEEEEEENKTAYMDEELADEEALPQAQNHNPLPETVPEPTLEELESLMEEEELGEEEEEAPPSAPPRRNFEESLAKLEKEVAQWSTKHPDAGTPISHESSPEKTHEEPEEDLEVFKELDELTVEEEAPAAQKNVETTEKLPPRMSVQGSANLAALPLPLSLVDSSLEAKIREELDRGNKAELSLMLIHCGVSSATDPAALALAVTVRDYIGSKDLIFELYKGAFAVVLPSVDLGSSLKMSEDLADVLSATLGLYKDIEGDAPVYIGISARAERKVDAFKLYREASTALHKAYEGSQSRILAFRPKLE